LEILYGGISDIGRVRKNNEDCFSMDERLGLFLVADGMGGHASGEVASRMAVEIINETYSRPFKGRKGPLLGNYDPTLTPASNRVLSSIRFANMAIFDAAQRKKEYHGMGTTIVALLIQDETATIANVGDSRIYRIREGLIEQLTEDHSLVYQQLKIGLITEEEARTSKAKNIITRALGVMKNVPIDVDEHVIQEDDRFILCSDGLTDLVKDEEILEIVTNNKEGPSQTCNLLIELANKRGGHDNITVLLVHIRKLRNKWWIWPLPKRKRYIRL
jgi:protein phosphatase